MASTDTLLRRFAVALSIILVLALCTLAVIGLLGGDGTSGPTSEAADPDAPTTRPYPGRRIEVNDREAPLTAGCIPSLVDHGAYVVSITNRGSEPEDYRVVVSLTAGDDTVAGLAEIPDLAPGEEREVPVLADQPMADIDDCTITVVESDRRVLLANS